MLHLLDRAREKGIPFNPDNCTIAANEVPIFVHLICDKGLKSVTSKIGAIVILDAPDCKSQVENMLGTVNYKAKFEPKFAPKLAPNLADVTNLCVNIYVRT